MFRSALLIGALLTLATPAAAETYMWGIGPRIGTNVLPGAYPSQLPRAVRDDNASPDGAVQSGIEKTRFDLLIGVDAVYYLNGRGRIGLLGGIDAGRGMLDAHMIGRYDQILVAEAVDLMVGGGVGVGTTRFNGTDDAKLVVNNFPLRVHASGLIRADFMAYQLTVFGQYNMPSSHRYTRRDGTVDNKPGGGIYPTLGVEFSVLFGDFTPPRPKRK